MHMGVPHEISIVAKGLPKAETKVKVVSPTNQVLEVPTTATGDGAKATFALVEPGPHVIEVSYGTFAVPQSPFKVDAVLGPPRVKAYGPGLTAAEAKKPATFMIDTREETNPGGIGLSVEGPAESQIQCVDNKDGTCEVTYIPPVAGKFNINVTYGERPIPGSPFVANVSQGGPDLSNVVAYGPGLDPKGRHCGMMGM